MIRFKSLRSLRTTLMASPGKVLPLEKLHELVKSQQWRDRRRRQFAYRRPWLWLPGLERLFIVTYYFDLDKHVWRLSTREERRRRRQEDRREKFCCCHPDQKRGKCTKGYCEL